MKKRKSFLLSLCLVALSVTGLFQAASAHIVPPEAYHPVAEAHRKIAFFVNLNPVLWDLVEIECARIAAEYDGLADAEGDHYRQAIRRLFEAIELEASISVPTPALRKETARGVFELSTQAVAHLIELHLALAEDRLADYETAGTSFEAARQIWEAFTHEVRATDPEGFRRIGAAWLEASSALGYPGLLGAGMKLADTEIFFSAAQTIQEYLRANFGSSFSAQDGSRLIALPVHSPTFDAMASVPPKLPPGSNINKQLPRPRQLLNFSERGVDESETVLIALGDMLFDSPLIFGEPARSLQMSCNTCHNKGTINPNLFVPGLSSRPGGMDVNSTYFAPHANNGLFDPLDTPDLRGIKSTAPYGRNGRFASLREFTRNVIVNEFMGREPAPVVLDALIAYINEFDFLPNPNLEPNGKLSRLASDASRRGELLFNKTFPQMNDMSCASCHVPSSHFTDARQHDIGSVEGASAYSTDGAMDTPTLLSSLYTAPYFHNGQLPTLGSVVDWFNDRYELGFSDAERADLTAYVEAVGAGEESYEDTLFTLEAELEEFMFFLSSYEYIQEIGDTDLAATLFKTVEDEIRAHKWDIQDMRYMPVLNELEDIMKRAYEAQVAQDPKTVAALVSDYRALSDEYAGIIN
ncbi:MAG: cytochrome c peroxidase [Candidatus Hydrogenedentes bacterium]|nr:cytochrome c peroxidase [Candidatus Hydrogenedentota bacterium]